MYDLISRQAVSSWLKQYGQDVLHGKYKFSLMYIWKNLMDLPTAQRNGTWITDVNDNNNAYCSECGLLTTKDLLKRIAIVGENKPKFCPNCGAKMEDSGR